MTSDLGFIGPHRGRCLAVVEGQTASLTVRDEITNAGRPYRHRRRGLHRSSVRPAVRPRRLRRVRAWSPARSVRTLPDRLRQSVRRHWPEIGAVRAVRSPPAGAGWPGCPYTTTSPPALAPAAAVMESIVEDAEIKSACYRDIEAVVGPDIPVWSSTSNFPMTRLAVGMAHPERAIVVHPVQTQLIIFVEVVAGEQTSEETVATTMGFCDDVGLRAVRVRKEIPGFLWNRVWFALLREMLHLVDIGAADPRRAGLHCPDHAPCLRPGVRTTSDDRSHWPRHVAGHLRTRSIPSSRPIGPRRRHHRTARRRWTPRRQERAGLLR